MLSEYVGSYLKRCCTVVICVFCNHQLITQLLCIIFLIIFKKKILVAALVDPALHQPPPADPGDLFSSASQLSAKQHRQRSVITTMWNVHFLFY